MSIVHRLISTTFISDRESAFLRICDRLCKLKARLNSTALELIVCVTYDFK